MSRVSLPWGAWYQDTEHSLELPAGWRVVVLEPRDAVAKSAAEIRAAIADPLLSPGLPALAAGRRSACIVVDDLARPTRAEEVLPAVLCELQRAGLARDAVRIVAATGTHGRLTREQLILKVGARIAADYHVESHDHEAPLTPTGIQYGQDELRLNSTFCESELRIGIGAVLPHSFAGYSGGAKLMLPGLANVEATARSHKFVQLGLRRLKDPNANGFRLEAEQLARRIGFDFMICVVPNRQRHAAAVFAGDLVAAHRRACEHAAGAYSTDLRESYDCLILNAYPKDIDLVQAESVMVALKSLESPAVNDSGVILITTAATHGIGQHGLFAPGGVSYRRPTRKPGLGGREIWLYAPGVSPHEARQLYWEGYPFFRDRAALELALAERFPQSCSAAVLPCAPLQLLQDCRVAAGAGR